MSKYGFWKGTPRENIPWNPEIDQIKCTGCGTCFKFCRNGVYSWDEQTDRPIVAEPFRCVVGCSSCMNQCTNEAISFPPLSMLKYFP